VLAVLLTAGAAQAVEPDEIFCDHLVLQRDKPLPIWGDAEPGEKVTVSFAGQKKTATADKKGKWQVVLKPIAVSNKPQTLTIAGKNTVTVKDVLVGDVWILGGQSNMGRGVGRHPKPKGIKWDNPSIRYWGGGDGSPYPLERMKASMKTWAPCRDEKSTRNCTAVGFYFAWYIQQQGIDVPQGILWHSSPGSIIQEWIPREGFRLAPELKALADRADSFYPDPKNPKRPVVKPGKRDLCGYYNGKIYPMVPFAIKGVVWYQGESDFRNRLWDIEMKVMAKSWRDVFSVEGDGGEIPFYWMQIQRSGGYCSPLIRQEQFNALKLVPNSGMAVLLDFDVNVHPRNKADAGIRAALWALNRDYGKKDIVPSGPLYKSHSVKGNKLIVEFDYTNGGLRLGKKDGQDPAKLTDGKDVPNVELAGKDKKWHKAVATIDGKTLVVSSDKVPNPIAVRYCYTNIPQPPFLYNGAGLPAAMFTTSE